MAYSNPVRDFVNAPYSSGDVLQYFGENPQLYSTSVCIPGSGCLKGHNGWDIYKGYGEPIFAIADGQIVETKEDAGGYGKHVRYLIEDFEITCGHLSVISCVPGQMVKAGDKIGEMGNTGFVVSGSTPYWKYNPYAGTHLHLGKRQVTIVPIEQATLHYLNSTIHVRVENYDNGYFGSIPFTNADFPPPYFLPVQLGDHSEYVGHAQQILMKKGYLPPIPQNELGYYGNKTRTAVLSFQLGEGVPLTLYEKKVLAGKMIGPKTINVLKKYV